MAHIHSQRNALPDFQPFLALFPHYQRWLDACTGQPHANLTFGQPQDAPSEELVAALSAPFQQPAYPPTYFAYSQNLRESVQCVADSLKERRGLQVAPEDITLVNGSLSGLTHVLEALTDPGDDVIACTPFYFFYGGMCNLCGARLVKVPTTPDFDLDVDAIVQSLTAKTRVVIINSPNNPTGRIYSDDTLARLASALQHASLTRARPICVVSDDAYARIVFDGPAPPSILAHYSYAVMSYTYGKSTLAPGERIGYLALSPHMPPETKEGLMNALRNAQLVRYSFPNTSSQRAIPLLENVPVNIAGLKRRRDTLHAALTAAGYHAVRPDGSFYMMVQVPACLMKGLDDLAFCDWLATTHRVIVLPGSLVELPGWVRLCVTASDAMVAYAVSVFQKIMQ